MATPDNLKRLHTLIWTLIYAGLLTLVLGLAVTRHDAPLGAWLVGCGGVLAGVGFVLIFVRARLRPKP